MNGVNAALADFLIHTGLVCDHTIHMLSRLLGPHHRVTAFAMTLLIAS